MDVLKKLEEKGVNTVQFVNKHKMLHTIPFILDEIVSSIQEDLKEAELYHQNIKQDVERVLSACKKYDNFFWRNVANGSLEAAEQYGELAEEIFNLLNNNKELWDKHLK